MLHNQINRNEAYNTIHANVCLLHTLDSCMGTKGKTFFSGEGYGAHHIMQLNCLTLCTSLDFCVG